MRRLGAVDWLLLVTLLPLWIGCMALSVWHVRVNPPGRALVFAVADGADVLPRVRRLLGPAGELRIGDQLVAMGGRDLRGASYVRVMAITNAVRISDPAARLEILRDGRPLSIELPVAQLVWSWEVDRLQLHVDSFFRSSGRRGMRRGGERFGRTWARESTRYHRVDGVVVWATNARCRRSARLRAMRFGR